MTLTSGVIGLPGSEPTMLFAGFDVSEGNLSLLGIIVFGVLGDMLGASIAYGIGYWGREELVERHGNKLHVSKQRLDRAHRWFDLSAPVPATDNSAAFPVWQATALGLLHGPAELLPISSSGHIAVVPWLAGWSYSRLDDELRKSFEVALHTGTAAALLISLRREV